VTYERLRTDPRSDRPIMAPGLSSGFPFKRLDYSTLDAIADHQPALPVASPSNRRRGLSPASLGLARGPAFALTIAIFPPSRLGGRSADSTARLRSHTRLRTTSSHWSGLAHCYVNVKP